MNSSSDLHISANEKLIKWPQNHWSEKCTAAVTTFQSTLRSQREGSLPRHSHSRMEALRRQQPIPGHARP
ncbi:Cytosolic 10-Formyltetrahydrofolate Dehydrogenase [Manis pentadactyla]|nr:Cytosolic 10-Formyltetrahydrofolate Dehydrogenase [Manis pentadactyla]